MSKSCLFCKIISGEIPSTKVFENESVIAFKDIQPAAEKHLLFVHKSHTADIIDMSSNAPEQLAEVFAAIAEYATDKEFPNGFRLINNKGTGAGQTIFHTHFHLLGGKRLPGFH